MKERADFMPKIEFSDGLWGGKIRLIFYRDDWEGTMMKKRMVCILLVFALTAAGATACGTAGTDAGDSAQETQTESSAAEEVAEWKNETGIEEERLEAFIFSCVGNEDSFEETYLKPMLDELVQGA